ncbi:TadE family type IV pilus minor pilin [Candidatus Frankia nodulisporulans]|uniref:TadE family type IV pilus minor pilin n=1 Tax=Candidatus Frankia nodulisporulans TaxID=2060052 RepID=UPI0013D851C1
MFLLAVWMLAVLFGQGRCGNAAGIGARLAARGESDAIVTAAAAAAAPPHATVRLSRHDGLIDVEVSASIGMAALGQNGLRQVVSAHAVIPAEPNLPPVATALTARRSTVATAAAHERISVAHPGRVSRARSRRGPRHPRPFR